MSGNLLGAALVAGAYLLLLALETARPLRRTVEPRIHHIARNLGTAGLSYACLIVGQAAVVTPVALLAERRGWGLLRLGPLPAAASLVLGVVLLDGTLWYWHWLNHRVPFFWRFHGMHHVDLDLDASTALRFHFGEMTLSLGYRAAQIALLGVSPEALRLWSLMLAVSILFHHSNVRLPIALERALVRVVVTPRMHGIHHSIVPAEASSNYASLLSLWDGLHRTLRLDVPQREITIGVPSYQQPAQVTFAKVQLAPFVAPPPPWRLPSGEVPERPAAGPHGRLVE